MSSIKKHVCQNCKEKITYKLRHKPLLCPKCQHKYSMKPKDEFHLLVAQDEYLSSGKSDEAFQKMYPYLYLYTKKILLKRMRGKASLNADQVEEKTLEAVSIFVEKYLKNDSFRITDSFGGYLFHAVTAPLYGYHVQKDDKVMSLNHKLEKYGNKHELIHKFFNITNNTLCFKEYDVEKDVLDHVEIDGVIDDIVCLIDIARKKLRETYGLNSSLQFLYGMYHFIEKKSDKFLSNYLDWIDVSSKDMIEEVKQRMYSYLISLKSGEVI